MMAGVVLGHVSDLHLPFEPALTWRQRFSKRALSVLSFRRRGALHRRDVLDALARDLRDCGVDHVLVTGDVTNFALPDEFARAAAWFGSLLPADRISVVPGNHDALVEVTGDEGLRRWAAWTRLGDAGWPFVHRVGTVSLIGVSTALPTWPLLAQGRIGGEQLAGIERALRGEAAAGQMRVVMLHHPVAAGAIGWRKSLVDAPALRALLARCGAELVVHGHAHEPRFDTLTGPGAPIPSLCVPSSSALASPREEGARWHRLELARDAGGDARARVEVRRYEPARQAFATWASYELLLPREAAGATRQNAPEPRRLDRDVALSG